MSKTTIIATIGPASNTAETLLALYRSGMTVARLNAREPVRRCTNAQ
ncbi:pyruvate kinase [Burkholderia sp. BE17]|nr:pyruvate kinase [Burkholderia sp. BE17]